MQGIQNALNELIEQELILHLATLTPLGKPYASQAPYILNQSDFYILISDLSQHTKNLLTHAEHSILIRQSGHPKSNPFSIPRLSTEALAQEIVHEREPILEAMQERHGETVALLSSMKDFRLVRLQALQGRFVQGFGQAYTTQGLQITPSDSD